MAQQMTTLEKELFEITKGSLWAGSPREFHVTNEIIKELQNQAVDGLALSIIPNSEKNRYLRAAHFAQIMSVQSAVIKCLKHAGINVAVLKGIAAGIYYPAPYLRRYGDIDLLVHPVQYLSAIKILQENGYKLSEDGEEDVTVFTESGFKIELHRRPLGLERSKERSFIESHILAGLDEIELARLDQPKMKFPMLPWSQNGLELIWHIRVHLYNGLGLRQIIDWMMFVDKCVNTTERYKEFESVLIQSGLANLAIVVTRMCQIYLGLDEAISWCGDADDSLCEELMTYILDQGNFGTKRDDDKAVKVLTKYRNPISFFIALQKKE